MRCFYKLIQVIIILQVTLTLQSVSAVDYLDQLPCFRLQADRREENTISRVAAPFAIAAERAYQRCEEKVEPIPFPKTETWTLLDYPIVCRDTKLGFYAQAWVRSTNSGKQLVIAFRGTQFTEIPDWLRGNFTTFRGFPWRTQFHAAREYATLVTSKNPMLPVVFTGHSLGGGLAEYCQRFTPNSKALVFHPSPNQGRLFGAGLSKYDKHVLRVFEKGELLRPFRWLLGAWNKTAKSGDIKGVTARWIDFRTGLPITQHSMTGFAIDLVRQAAVSNDEGAKSVLDQIADARVREGQTVHRWWQ